MTDILIVGAGNMGSAIGKGLLREKTHHVHFKTLEGVETDKSNFEHEIAENRVFFNDYYRGFMDLNKPWIILAVKPHLVSKILTEAKEFLEAINPKAIISVAAGIDIQAIKESCPDHIPIIRAMPNTPVATGNGVMGYYCAQKALGDDFQEICKPLGLVPELINEEAFHLFTALAGSGPAYIFHLVEALSEAAHQLGMARKEAVNIARQTFLGAASLLEIESPTSLRQKVTSPNGTTQAGLEQLMNADLNSENSELTQLLYKTLEAAKKRSENIG